MIQGKSFLAIIPARGGSKGLPGKNIKELCGKPLIAWSIEAGLGSQYIDEVMVTTDSEEIAKVAREFGASVPFLRPAPLASDTATTLDAVKHVIDFYQREFHKSFDYIVLLEPTSPLREEGDLDGMIETISTLGGEYDAIVSLGEVHEHPSIMKKTVGNAIEPYCKELVMATRRQDNEVAYFPYGVAYIVKTQILLEEKTFYPRRTTHHLIKRFQCYEIDDIYDFLAIENIMKHEWELK
ncbi:acylneuraminate cytidylyltransferase family protein [Devosia sp.]|uniref:acylneuraminate cytidylyltransferase family protein n=1 Tax=Devosia sp. TaxID=1871048 RepID=UPI002732FF4C|nr:acylneuraminate cytidylyltransferase family protein [Devosia sp.]MDP2782323.1 acylneuraminate cytidylyltransferase family protein [Devosia sp.]